jgi:NAD(P)H-quinone oxidoreductase subunit 5
LLIQLLAWVILRFSARYFSGETGQARFLRAVGWLLAVPPWWWPARTG